jgi:hypothetical protein
MSTKPNLLRNAMLGVQQADLPATSSGVAAIGPALATAMPTRAPVAASRVGKRSISGHVEPAVQKQLRRLAVDLDRSHQSLLDEALNDLFRKYNRSAIA